MTRTFYTKKINLRQILYQRPEYNGLVKLFGTLAFLAMTDTELHFRFLNNRNNKRLLWRFLVYLGNDRRT